MCKSCSNAGFTCFEARFGAQPPCLHPTRNADTPEPALECGGHVQRPGDTGCALLQPHLFNISWGFLWGCVPGKRCFHLKSPKLAIYGIFPGEKEYQPRVWFFFTFFTLPEPGVASEPSLPSLHMAELLDLCCATGLLKCFSLLLQEVCSERPPQDLQAPDHAGGFWELLLHFPFLQGQGESFTSTLQNYSRPCSGQAPEGQPWD